MSRMVRSGRGHHAIAEFIHEAKKGEAKPSPKPKVFPVVPNLQDAQSLSVVRTHIDVCVYGVHCVQKQLGWAEERVCGQP